MSDIDHPTSAQVASMYVEAAAENVMRIECGCDTVDDRASCPRCLASCQLAKALAAFEARLPG